MKEKKEEKNELSLCCIVRSAGSPSQMETPTGGFGLCVA
jgi:hypothetical protein